RRMVPSHPSQCSVIPNAAASGMTDLTVDAARRHWAALSIAYTQPLHLRRLAVRFTIGKELYSTASPLLLGRRLVVAAVKAQHVAEDADHRIGCISGLDHHHVIFIRRRQRLTLARMD